MGVVSTWNIEGRRGIWEMMEPEMGGMEELGIWQDLLCTFFLLYFCLWYLYHCFFFSVMGGST